MVDLSALIRVMIDPPLSVTNAADPERSPRSLRRITRSPDSHRWAGFVLFVLVRGSRLVLFGH